MYYCHTRYYVPEWGRWLNADHSDYLKFDDINGMNLFAYCGNNPVMYSDPSGEFVSTILGAVFGFAWGALSAFVSGKDNIWASALHGAAVGALAGLAVDVGVATGGVGGFAIAAIGGFAVGFFGDMAGQVLVDGQKSIDYIQALKAGATTMVSNMLGFGISIAASGLGKAMPKDMSIFSKMVSSLKPVYTPLGSWIGQSVLGFAAASFSVVHSLASRNNGLNSNNGANIANGGRGR